MLIENIVSKEGCVTELETHFVQGYHDFQLSKLNTSTFSLSGFNLKVYYLTKASVITVRFPKLCLSLIIVS